jgi:hypothetical protein
MFLLACCCFQFYATVYACLCSPFKNFKMVISPTLETTEISYADGDSWHLDQGYEVGTSDASATDRTGHEMNGATHFDCDVANVDWFLMVYSIYQNILIIPYHVYVYTYIQVLYAHFYVLMCCLNISTTPHSK